MKCIVDTTLKCTSNSNPIDIQTTYAWLTMKSIDKCNVTVAQNSSLATVVLGLAVKIFERRRVDAGVYKNKKIRSRSRWIPRDNLDSPLRPTAPK